MYPSVMHNPTIYEQYIAVVRAIAEELSDVRREEDLVTAWHERRDIATAVIERSPPTMRAVQVQRLRFAARALDSTGRWMVACIPGRRTTTRRIDIARWWHQHYHP